MSSSETSATCIINDFNNKSNEELIALYKSYTTDEDKAKFNFCFFNKYGSNVEETNIFESTNNINNIQNNLDSYEDELEKTKNAESINENTISLYNNDLLYIILKISLFVLLAIVYIYYVKNINFSYAVENIKNKTIGISQKIKDTTTLLTTKQITNPIQNPVVK